MRVLVLHWREIKPDVYTHLRKHQVTLVKLFVSQIIRATYSEISTQVEREAYCETDTFDLDLDAWSSIRH